MNSDELVFREEDCVVSGTKVQRSTGGESFPRWGSQNGNVDQYNVLGGNLNAVTVMHVPTGITITIDRFTPKRNKELAMIEMKKLVDEWIVLAQSHGQE